MQSGHSLRSVLIASTDLRIIRPMTTMHIADYISRMSCLHLENEHLRLGTDVHSFQDPTAGVVASGKSPLPLLQSSSQGSRNVTGRRSVETWRANIRVLPIAHPGQDAHAAGESS